MALFLPTIAVERVTDITPALMNAMGANTILLDVDNTLALYGSQEPLKGSIEWAQFMEQAGFKLIILSNNYKKRVEPFAAKYRLPFLFLSCKPLPFAYYRAMHKMKAKRKETVVVGDQVFTDVIGSNLSFIKSILLTPVKTEETFTFHIKRRWEKPIRRKIIKKGLSAEHMISRKNEHNKE